MKTNAKEDSGKYIPGGYVLDPRIMRETELEHATPCTREVYRYLRREANHAPATVSGRLLKRGQLVRTRKQIRQDLHWNAGYARKAYTLSQIGTALRLLTDWG